MVQTDAKVCGPGCGDDVCQENGLCPAVLGDCLNGWCLIPAGTFSMGLLKMRHVGGLMKGRSIQSRLRALFS